MSSATAGRRGRPSRPYRTSWGEDVAGLYKCPDGRWRLTRTGEKFTEHDERRAVARLRASEQPPTVPLPSQVAVKAKPDADDFVTGLTVRSEVPATEYWAWLREQLIEQPEYVARMTGIPELANLRHLPLPRAAIKLETLIEKYLAENPSTEKSKHEAIAVVRRLMEHTGATALNELTQDKLMAFRAAIEADPKLRSAGTRAGYYGRVKTIISFGLKVGMDQSQLRAALDRCKVLWTAGAMPQVSPEPISKENFHALLAASGTTLWRPWLLLALNLCMTTEDLCELRHEHFDLARGVYAAVRVKTRRDRIPRAGLLWAETLEAIRSLPRRGDSPHLFTSSHGTRFNKNGRVNEFAELRHRAGLPDSIKFSHLRDGAYTAACQGSTDEKWARVLAGHRAAGLMDSYVLRNPEATRPACEAVYRAYGPFPVPAAS